MSQQDEKKIVSLLKENTAVVQENNHLLKRMYRNAIIEMWLRVVWYAVLIGLPFALYFYILEPYRQTFEGVLEQLHVTVPGLEKLQVLLKEKQQ